MSMFHRQVWTERTLSHDYMQVDRSCQCTIGNPFIRHSGDTIFPRETNVLTSGTCRAQDITHSYWSLGSSLSSSKFSLSSFEATPSSKISVCSGSRLGLATWFSANRVATELIASERACHWDLNKLKNILYPWLKTKLKQLFWIYSHLVRTKCDVVQKGCP